MLAFFLNVGITHFSDVHDHPPLHSGEIGIKDVEGASCDNYLGDEDDLHAPSGRIDLGLTGRRITSAVQTTALGRDPRWALVTGPYVFTREENA